MTNSVFSELHAGTGRLSGLPKQMMLRMLMSMVLVAVSAVTRSADFSATCPNRLGVDKTIWYHIVSENTVEVTSPNKARCAGYAGDVTIPATVDYNGVTYTVVGIGTNAIYYYDYYQDRINSDLTSLTLPNTITYISNGAFYYCNSIPKLYLTDLASYVSINFGNIESSPFYKGYTQLYVNNELVTELTLPNVTEVGDYAFYGGKFYSVTIPSTVLSLGNKCFGNCKNLYKIVSKPNTVPAGFGTAFENLANRVAYVGNHNYDDYAEVMGTINIYTNLSSMFEVGGVRYVPVPTTRTVDAIDCDYKTENITVPSTVTFQGVSLSVGNVKKNAFRGNASIKQFVLGGNVPAIEDHAFSNCTGLCQLTFESGSTTLSLGNAGNAGMFRDNPITTVNIHRELSYDDTSAHGNSPFYGNTTINTVNVGGQARTIFSKEFGGCTALNVLTTSGELNTIQSQAFKGMGLTDITLDGNKLHVGDEAFMDCATLAGVILNTGVGNIGNAAFKNCVKIRSALSLATVNDLAIGNEAFMNCPTITSLSLGQGVTAIGNDAFNGCLLVARLNLSEKVTAIGAGAFENCKTITSLTIPSKVTTINDRTFKGCDRLSAINLPANITSIGSQAFAFTPALTSIELPMQLKTLGNHAFESSAIRTVDIPTGVTAIAEGTFKNSLIEELAIKNVVTSVAESAFYNCILLDRLTINDGTKVLTLGRNVERQGLFHDCRLTTTYIGRPLSFSGAEGDGYSPFYGNTTMQNVTLDGSSALVPAKMFAECTALDVVSLNKDILAINESAFKNSGVRSINIPSKVSAITNSCFMGTRRLESIVIPETVKDIDVYAFSGSGLRQVVIPSSIHTIADHSFSNCFQIETLVLPESVTLIDTYAFAGSSLPMLNIPKSVTTVGNGAFDDCTNFSSLIIADGASELSIGYNAASQGMFYDCPLDNVYIGRNISYSTSSAYGWSPFYRNTSLKSVEIGDIPSEVFIYEFYGCSGLTSAIVGDGVNKISDYAFSGCESLEEFEIGASVTNIGNEAFSDCSKMTSFRTYAVLPPVCGNEALADINKFYCTLYIPQGAESVYLGADQWNEFFKTEEFDAGVKVSYIELSQSSATMNVGQTLTLTAIAYPEQALLRTISWTSSNTEVATVDQTGQVTALRDGVVDIVATANDGSGVRAQCKITVLNEDTPGTYRFAISNAEALSGTTVRIPVELINDGGVLGYQFDLILPTGMTLDKDDYDDYYVEMGDRAKKHTCNIGENNGVYTVVVMSMNNLEISGNDGVVCYLPVCVAGDPRECIISLRNIHLSKTGNIDEELTPVSATVTVKPSFIKGDANGDLRVSIADVTSTINYIIGKGGANFVFEAADIDGNGKILISDVTAILNLVLNPSTGSSNVPSRSSAYCHSSTASLSLAETAGCVALQFDVELPQDSRISSIRLNGTNAESHNVMFSQHGHTARVAVFSMSNMMLCGDNAIDFTIESRSELSGMAFAPTNGYIVELQGNESVEREALIGKLIINDATSIESDYAEKNASTDNGMFNLNGLRVLPQSKGIVVVKGKKTIKK